MRTNNKEALPGSHDPQTGQCFYPARPYSVEGALRELTDVEIEARGRLAEFIAMGDRWYGYVDLPGEVRVLTELGPGPHQIGAVYHLATAGDAERRFDRA
jgi:hypothetical protein